MKIFGILLFVVILTGCGGDGGGGDVLFASTNTTSEEPTAESPTTEEPTAETPTTEEPPTLEPPTLEPPTVEPPTVEPPTVEPPTVEPPTEKWTIHSEIPFDYEISKAFIDGDFIYVAASFRGASVIDATNVADPETIWNIESGDYGSGDTFSDVMVTGNLAIFIAYPRCDRWCEGLSSATARVYEITDPAEPVLMDSFTLNSGSLGANENLLYAAISDGRNGAEFRIIDLSDPSNADIVGSVEIQTAGQLAVIGQMAYVSYNDLSSFKGIDAVNIADPANPTMLGEINFRVSNVRHSPIALSDDTAYIADQRQGLQVVDITDPANIQLVANIPTTSNANDVAVAGGYLYVAQDRDGVAIYDIDNPTDPQFVQYIETPAPALSISVSERIGAVGIDWTLEEYGGTGCCRISEPHKLLLFLTHE
tara:strand:+ start:308 stop:1576 length:1269 start_codon:yes stop_codon:yes gene_type:complete